MTPAREKEMNFIDFVDAPTKKKATKAQLIKAEADWWERVTVCKKNHIEPSLWPTPEDCLNYQLSADSLGWKEEKEVEALPSSPPRRQYHQYVSPADLAA
jgi:hypothetical protein